MKSVGALVLLACAACASPPAPQASGIAARPPTVAETVARFPDLLEARTDAAILNDMFRASLAGLSIAEAVQQFKAAGFGCRTDDTLGPLGRDPGVYCFSDWVRRGECDHTISVAMPYDGDRVNVAGVDTFTESICPAAEG